MKILNKALMGAQQERTAALAEAQARQQEVDQAAVAMEELERQHRLTVASLEAEKQETLLLNKKISKLDRTATLFQGFPLCRESSFVACPALVFDT